MNVDKKTVEVPIIVNMVFLPGGQFSVSSNLPDENAVIRLMDTAIQKMKSGQVNITHPSRNSEGVH